MATYAVLATLTERGAQDLKGIVERRAKNMEELAQRDIRVIADFALMGEYDFLYIVEAPDNVTIMQETIKDLSAGTLRFQTLPAIPMEQFVELTKGM
jgi:uncharacterized protein with GYD domain